MNQSKYRLGYCPDFAARVDVVRHQSPFPYNTKTIDKRIDRKVAFATIEPSGSVIQAHNRKQAERRAVYSSLERLARPFLQDR